MVPFSGVRVALLLALFAEHRPVEGRVHVLEKFSQALLMGGASCRTLVVQSDATRGADYELFNADTFSSTPSVEDLHIINKINSLEPRAFQRLAHLHSLHLGENNLPTLRAGDFAGLRLARLDLVDNDIAILQPSAFANSTISSIDLSQNRLQTIPARAVDHPGLTQLRLADNRIERIAERAFSVDLVQLDLSGNRIREVPLTAFENLFALRHLNVSRNRLPTLASVLWLRELEVLDASYNSIRLLLNGAFEDYPKLRVLRLDHNELVYLNPASFSKPSPIEELYLQRNMLAFLLPELGAMFTSLRVLRYGGNPWSCACLAQLEHYVKAAKLPIDPCDKKFFTSGEYPVCLTAYGTCFYNETLLLLEHNAMVTSVIAGYNC